MERYLLSGCNGGSSLALKLHHWKHSLKCGSPLTVTALGCPRGGAPVYCCKTRNLVQLSNNCPENRCTLNLLHCVCEPSSFLQCCRARTPVLQRLHAQPRNAPWTPVHKTLPLQLVKKISTEMLTEKLHPPKDLCILLTHRSAKNDPMYYRPLDYHLRLSNLMSTCDLISTCYVSTHSDSYWTPKRNTL